MSQLLMDIVLGRRLVAFIETKGHFSCSWVWSSDTREQIEVREWFIRCHGVGQGWHLPTTLRYKWRAEWINLLDPLRFFFPQTFDLKKPIKVSVQTVSVSQMNCAPHA